MTTPPPPDPSPEELARREAWFREYTTRLDRQPQNLPLRCPCCKCRTLKERGGDDICPVCFWQDDGQDDYDADVIRGGPNSDLSLTAARDNYRRLGACQEQMKENVRPPRPEELPESDPSGADPGVNLKGIRNGLLSTLQQLAWPADVQCTMLYPPVCQVAEDMAMDFDNFREAALANLALNDHQRHAVATVDRLLAAMSRGGARFQQDLWTEEALRTRREWSEVRDAALEALIALGVRPLPLPTHPIWEHAGQGITKRAMWLWREE